MPTIKVTKWSKIIWRTSLEERSEEANNRTEIGHFEADLVVSKKWCKSAFLTLLDRKSILPRIYLLKDKISANIMEIILIFIHWPMTVSQGCKKEHPFEKFRDKIVWI